jgi:hypothetical protein
MFAESGVDRYRRCLEWNMEQIHLRSLLEHLTSEMLSGCKARAGKYDLARISFCCRDQLFHVVGWKIRPRHDQQACSRDLPTGANAVNVS